MIHEPQSVRGASPTLYEEMQALIDSGAAAEAEARVRKALETEPDSVRLKQLLGRTLLRQNKLGEAVGAFVEATEAAPTDPNCCLDLGKAVYRLGWYDQAALAARRTIDLDALSVDAFELLADALKGSGDAPAAYEAMRRAYDILRNDLGKMSEDLNENVIQPPLILDDLDVAFLNWRSEGRGGKFCLIGQNMAGQYLLRIALGEEAQAGLVEEGRLSHDVVALALPEHLAAQLEVFESNDYPYTLSKIAD